MIADNNANRTPQRRPKRPPSDAKILRGGIGLSGAAARGNGESICALLQDGMGLSMILSAAADINVGHPARRQGRRFGDYRNAFPNSGNFLRKRIKSRRSLV